MRELPYMGGYLLKAERIKRDGNPAGMIKGGVCIYR
jgi:hypothetical protein